MIVEDALFEVLEDAVTNSVDALMDAQVFSSTRGAVNKSEKTVRIQMFNGFLSPISDELQKEMKCEFVIQCLAKVKGVGYLPAEQEAQAIADAMGKEVFNTLINNQDLNGKVCSVSFEDADKNFDRLIIDIGATKYGSFYLYGTVNP